MGLGQLTMVPLLFIGYAILDVWPNFSEPHLQNGSENIISLIGLGCRYQQIMHIKCLYQCLEQKGLMSVGVMDIVKY